MILHTAVLGLQGRDDDGWQQGRTSLHPPLPMAGVWSQQAARQRNAPMCLCRKPPKPHFFIKGPQVTAQGSATADRFAAPSLLLSRSSLSIAAARCYRCTLNCRLQTHL